MTKVATWLSWLSRRCSRGYEFHNDGVFTWVKSKVYLNSIANQSISPRSSTCHLLRSKQKEQLFNTDHTGFLDYQYTNLVQSSRPPHLGCRHKSFQATRRRFRGEYGAALVGRVPDRTHIVIGVLSVMERTR